MMKGILAAAVLSTLACGSKDEKRPPGEQRPGTGAATAAAPADASLKTTLSAADGEASGPIVVMYMEQDRAVILGCGNPDRAEGVIGDATKCMKEVVRDRTVAPLGGGPVRTLSAETTIDCVPTPDSDPIETRAAIGVDSLPAAGRHDPSNGPSPNEFMVWPANRVTEAKTWRKGAAVDMVAMTAKLASASAGLKSPSGRYELREAPEVLGALDAELDGDGKPDTVYSVTLPSDDAPFFSPQYLVASLSSKGGELVVLTHDLLMILQAVAALDVDQDGRDEILYVTPYYEGGGAVLATFEEGKLTTKGSWWCGM